MALFSIGETVGVRAPQSIIPVGAETINRPSCMGIIQSDPHYDLFWFEPVEFGAVYYVEVIGYPKSGFPHGYWRVQEICLEKLLPLKEEQEEKKKELVL